MVNLQNIRIIGGVHTNKKYLTDITEQQLEQMIDEVSRVITKHVRTDAWVTVEYKKSYGHKLNS